MRHLVQTFFDGSTGDAVAALLGTDVSRLSSDELERLAVLIAEARRRTMIAFDSFSAPVVGSLLVRVTAVLP